MISALRQAMISVEDMEQSTYFYKDLIGLEVIMESRSEGETFERLWQLPTGTEAMVRILGNPDKDWGRIRLVSFSPRSNVIIRKTARIWDHGLFDIAFLGENANVTYETFRKEGFHSSEIAVYDIEAYEGMRLREVLVRGPDGVMIAFLHYDPPYTPRGLKGFSELLHIVIMVSDMEKSLGFYRDILGMDPQTDMIMDNDTVRHLLDTPHNARVRMISLKRQKGFTGRVMLMQVMNPDGSPVECRDYSSESVPPNIGLCLLAFDAVNIREFESRLRENGIEIICKPQRIEGAPFNNRRVMTIKSPEGTLIEFTEAGSSGD